MVWVEGFELVMSLKSEWRFRDGSAFIQKGLKFLFVQLEGLCWNGICLLFS